MPRRHRRFETFRPTLAWVLVVALGPMGLGCTEPNPNARGESDDGSETESAGESGADGSSTTDTGDEGGCPVGELACPCDAGGCNDDLLCAEDICVPPDCGNGTLDDAEECDEGDANANDAECTSACTRARCGDGHVGPGEQCDDANANDADACRNDCRWTDSIDCEDGENDVGDFCYGAFEVVDFPIGGTADVDVADLDLDGLDDLIITDGSGAASFEVHVLLGQDDDTLQAAPSLDLSSLAADPGPLAVVDHLPGGRPELIVLGTQGADTVVIRIAPNDSAGLFAAPQASSWPGMTFTDVQSVDVGAQATPRAFALSRENADFADFGPTGDPIVTPLGNLGFVPAALGDGQDALISWRPDLTDFSGQGPRVQVLRFGGASVPTVVQSIDGIGGAEGRAADFDGDGDDDFLTWTASSCAVGPLEECPLETLTLLAGSPDNPPLEQREDLALAAATRGSWAGDVDGDGDDDLLLASRGAQALVILEGDSDLSFTHRRSVPLTIPDSPLLEVRSGDLNGDGVPELIVVGSSGSNAIRVAWSRP